MKTRFKIKLAIFALCVSTAMGAEPGFTFKNFSPGMPLDDAEKLIKEKYSNAFGEVTSGQIPDDMRVIFPANATYWIAISAFRFPIGEDARLCVVEADSQKKVFALRFPGSVVDILFNSGDMSPRDFAKQFINSYNVPELKACNFPPVIGAAFGSIGGWEYTSPKGFRVRIGENKDLIVEAVPSSENRKFD